MSAATPLIAIVDDDESIRLSFMSLVRSLGYRARAHASAEDLLAAMALCLPDCIISDIRMPDMDGITMLERLRDSRRLPPVILITAYAEPVLRARAIAAGAWNLLLKPMDETSLIACIDAVLPT